tara:strand:+ start:678 stop:995 length:318 start_codon:yes stop_codon:yes gene_type:complete
MKLSEKTLRRIILEELYDVVLEKCIKTAIDRSITHKGSGPEKRSYIQVKTTQLCDDEIQTPEEQAEIRKKRELEKKARRKKAESSRKKWRQEKDRAKQSAIRPDK